MRQISLDAGLVTFSDLKRLYLRNARWLHSVMLACSAVVFIFLMFQEPRYKLEATFQEAERERENGLSVNMKEAVQQLSGMTFERGTAAVMQSNEVLRKTVEDLGLQIKTDPDFFIVSAIKRIGRNIAAQFKFHPSRPEQLKFGPVVYSGEKSLQLFLKIDETGLCHLLGPDRAEIGVGKAGESISFPSGHLTLRSLPERVSPGHVYRLVISPWESIVAQIKKHLKISPFKTDKTILQLTFHFPDRFQGADILNRIMRGYQDYLKAVNDEICKSQLSHLQKRQEELTGNYEKALREHAAYLSENLQHNGFIGFTQEIEALSEPKNLYMAKLLDLDLELKRGEAFPLLPQKEADGPFYKTTLLEIDPRESNEFSGLNLATAQGLVIEYTRERDALQAKVRELIFLRDQISRPDFEMSSLGGVFEDQVAKDLVNQAGTIALQLKDENNRSAREQERLLETLQTQKNFLSHYLLQTIELKKLREKLLGEKIQSLQQTTLSLLNSEKGLIEDKLGELNEKMGVLPENWRRESLLVLKKELAALMLQGISQIAESKQIGQLVYQTASKPLNKASAFVPPKSPNLIFYPVLAAILAGLFSYCLVFFKTLAKGLPSSDETLKLAGFPVSGSLTKYCRTNLSQIYEGDLETLRHIAEFLTSSPKTGEGKVALSIGGKYPDYSSALAELLSMRGVKTVVVHCVFDQVVHASDTPGLWHYLNDQIAELPIRRRFTYDYVPSGGTTRHALETLCSPKFTALLNQLKKKYDLVLLYSSADPLKAEATSLLKLADFSVVTVQQETKEELMGYREHCTTFVYAEEFS
jgi:hypothetical protein